MERATTANIHADFAVTTVRVERHMLDRFREICQAEHRSFSQELRRMIERRIAGADAEQAA